MNRQNRKRGFTMAEMLIVVAIIGVLGAVAFVAVNQHQRSLERLERDSVAREIFIAAQNHLTMAESQGYLGVSDKKGTVEDAAKGYYFFVYPTDKYSADGTPKTLLDLMLPFGSIDETVRGGGSYIIRYHPDTATVMDVFYCSNESTDSRFGHTLTADEEKDLVANWRKGKESARKNYKGKVLGWYGGATAETLSRAEVYAPIIVVKNADKLRIGIQEGKGPNGETNPQKSSLQVIVKGMTSGAEKAFTLKSDKAFAKDARVITGPADSIEGVTCGYEIILDDITTANMHFADMTADKNGPFIPGEDVKVQAIAFDNTQISNIGYSAEITVNSLFEKIEEGTKDVSGKVAVAAYVNNIRHLENLDKRVSNVSVTREEGTAPNKTTYNLNSAVQTSDISWSEFKKAINGDDAETTEIFEHKQNADDTAITTAGNYLPVRTAIGTGSSYLTSYDGQYHSISDIKVDYAGNAGLFESITGVSATQATITNLALIDFDVSYSGTGNFNAGALAGILTYVDVTNVIAYNSKSTITAGIVAASGNAGGLIGYASACNVTKSAASVYVTATKGNAGGLIGMTDGGKVSSCYSGGHTNKGTYYNDDRTEIYNVQAAAKNAGGLIGVASETPIDHSYATCSVMGQTAGGFVASAVGDVSFCYATGLVAGTGSDNITTVINGVSTSKTVTKDGAFAYSLSGNVDNCYYFEIINERKDEEAGYKCLKALGKEGEDVNIQPLDSDSVDDLTLNIYNNLYANPANWTNASAYDPKLIEYYDGKYNLLNVVKLGATDVIEAETTNEDGKTTPADFVATHYGDWPAPEIFVVNTAS